MAKFMLPTLTSRAIVHQAIHNSYTIYLNASFEVTDGEDIDYFRKNKRFKEVMFKVAAPVIDPKVQEADFWNKLMKLGVPKKESDDIVSTYLTESELKTNIQEGNFHDHKISKKTQKILIDHYQ